MNYQSFLEMNVLLSDPMLQAVQDNKIALIFAVVLLYYISMIFNIIFITLISNFVLDTRASYLVSKRQKDSV